jgi:hypothetical protein
MGLFSEIAKAQVNLGGNYLKPPGKYLLYIEACKTPSNRKNKDYYVVEFSILQCNNPACPAGMRASWTANLSDHDAALGNVKGFLAAALGVTFEQIDESGAEASVSAENPLRGRLIYADVTNVKTKANTDFSKHIWTPVPDELQAKAEELRKTAA